MGFPFGACISGLYEELTNKTYAERCLSSSIVQLFEAKSKALQDEAPGQFTAAPTKASDHLTQ